MQGKGKVIMKKLGKGILCSFMMMLLVLSYKTTVKAEAATTILPGIYIDSMDVGGQTAEQAKAMVQEYVAGLQNKSITLKTVNDNEIVVTAGELGLSWSNPEIIDEAASLGTSGNIVQRYKTIKDIENENYVFTISYAIDKEMVRGVLQTKGASFNVEAVDAVLTRNDGVFSISEGTVGCVVDEDASIEAINTYITTQWNKEDGSIDLVVVTDEPRGSAEELSQVKDVLGTFSTSFSTSGSSRSANVRNGCSLINGVTLYPGDEFSTYDTVSPFSESNGYYMAGSYLNGQVVDSLGGGICQVSTTLYNAVLLSELEVTERHNHSMIISYVNPSQDAAISESAGKDFKFKNSTDYPIYIEGYTTDDKHIYFTIYGVETRDAGHQVSYVSEVTSKKVPDTEVVYTDAAQPVGYVAVQSTHIGYKANLWKVVTENGVETSREIINSSSYQMAPRSATVGVATADPNAYNEIMAAISTNNIDHIKGVAAALAAATAPAPEQAPAAPVEAPAAETAQ